MARVASLSADAVAKVLREAGLSGMSTEVLASHFPGISRSTLTRRLAELIHAGAVKLIGCGRATRYAALAAYAIEDVRRYFETDWASRPLASYQEQLLQPTPEFDPDLAHRLINLQARARGLDKRFLSDFLIGGFNSEVQRRYDASVTAP